MLKILIRLAEPPEFIRSCNSDCVISEELVEFIMRMVLPAVEDIVYETGI